MTKIRLRYVHAFEDRHGHVRRYFRRPGFKSVVLPGAPGTREFNEAYEAAMEGRPIEKRPIGAARTKEGTIAALVAKFFASPSYVTLGPQTKNTYRGIIDRFRNEHGERTIKGLTREKVKSLVAARAATPAAANNMLRMIRLLMAFAIEEGLRTDNPTLGVKKIRCRPKGFHSWTDAEIAAFEAKWPVGTRARLAEALLLYTGQRRSDVVRMGWPAYRGSRISVRQQKTGVSLEIPAHQNLRLVLDGTPREHVTFLMTEHGKPFSPAGFTNWFVLCAREAGLPAGCAPHGLRKAASRRLAEAGCTTKQIMAITGHASLDEIERYTRAADQVNLAEQAIARLETNAEQPVANPTSGFPNRGKQ